MKEEANKLKKQQKYYKHNQKIEKLQVNKNKTEIK